MIYRKSKIIVLAAFFFLLFGTSVEANSRWEYSVTESLTAQKINTNSTIAIFDYDQKTIQLPTRPLPGAIEFTSDGSIEYAVIGPNGITAFSFDGEQMIENPLLSIDGGLDNPVSFALSTMPTPTICVAEENGDLIKQYRYDSGSPSLAISGLERILSVSSYRTGEIIAMSQEKATFLVPIDNQLMPVPGLTAEGLIDPIAIATGDDYETAVLMDGGVKWFSFDGSTLIHNPIMSYSGNFEDPLTITASGQSFAIIEQGEVELYSYNSQNMAVSFTASVPDLNNPVGVALRPGTKDMVVIDKKGINDFELRYFMYDGSGMIENLFLAQTVSSLLRGDQYQQRGVVISEAQEPIADYANWLRIRANIDLPNDTGIKWYLASSGTEETPHWYPAWRADRINNDLIIRKYHDDSWKLYRGDINDIFPKHDTNESYPPVTLDPDEENPETKNILETLWVPIAEEHKGGQVRWKAEMYTNDKSVTPKIITEVFASQNDLSVVWEANATPFAPVIEDVDDNIGDDDHDNEHETDIGDDDPADYAIPTIERKDGWIYSTTPTIYWSFQDPDGDSDSQSAYQVRLLNLAIVGPSDLANVEDIPGAIIYDSLPQQGSETSYQIGTSGNSVDPGPMWLSGNYSFAVQVRTWDKNSAESPWSAPALDTGEGIDIFNVLAFERPRIVELVNPPEDNGEGESYGPEIENPATHRMVPQNASIGDLPIFKAGTWVTVRLDGVGPIDPEEIRAVFRYEVDGSRYVILNSQIQYCDNYTQTHNENQQFDIKFFTEAPIEMFPDGTLVKMYAGGRSVEGIDAGKTIKHLPPYADGVAVSSGTAYEMWYVVLQGSKRDD